MSEGAGTKPGPPPLVRVGRGERNRVGRYLRLRRERGRAAPAAPAQYGTQSHIEAKS